MDANIVAYIVGHTNIRMDYNVYHRISPSLEVAARSCSRVGFHCTMSCMRPSLLGLMRLCSTKMHYMYVCMYACMYICILE